MKKLYWPAMFGAAIEYYEISLYGYMAPILVALFLPNLPKLEAYTYFFSFEVFATLMQLLGSYILGNIADRYGRKYVMYYSLIATSFFTFAIALLPTYKSIGTTAAVLFIIFRAMQRFFLGAEYIAGAIYCFEHESNTKKYGSISGMYAAITFVGVIAAALVATAVNHYGEEYFRLAYGSAFIFMIITYLLRRNMKETREFVDAKINKQKTTSNRIQINYSILLATFSVISVIAGCMAIYGMNVIFAAIAIIAIASIWMQIKFMHGIKSYTNAEKRIIWHCFWQNVAISTLCSIVYGLPSRIANALVPLEGNMSTGTIMWINNILLLLYMFLVLYLGKVSDRIGISKMIKIGVIFSAIVGIPAFWLLGHGTILFVTLAKIIFVIAGAFLSAPLSAWSKMLFTIKHRHQLLSVSYSFSRLVNTFLTAASIHMFNITHSYTMLGGLITINGLIASFVLSKKL